MNEELQQDADEPYDEELYDADPACEHKVESAPGGGVKCTKCPGWFCF